MFKKQLAILLALVMALTLVACASGNKDEQTSEQAETQGVVPTTQLTDQEKYGEISLPDGYEPVGNDVTSGGYIGYKNEATGVVVNVVSLENNGVDLEMAVMVYEMGLGLSDEEIEAIVPAETTVDGKAATLVESNVPESDMMKSAYFFEGANGIRYIEIEHTADNTAERDSIIANYKAE